MIDNRQIPELIIKIYSVINDVKNNLENYNTSNLEERPPDATTTGFYIKDENKNIILWFGTWFDLWKEKGFSLAFGLHKDTDNIILDKFNTCFKDKIFQYDDWLLCGIDKLILEDKKPVDNILELLNNYL